MKNNEKVIELLKGFITAKKINSEVSGWKESNEKCVFTNYSYNNIDRGEWAKKGVFSYEEAFKYRPFLDGSDKKLNADFIPQELFNKKIILDDFEIHFQYESENIFENDSKFNSFEYRRVIYRINSQWNIILNYHGSYNFLGKYKNQYYIVGNECLPECGNWGNKIIPTPEKPYVLDEATNHFEHNNWDKLKNLVENLDISLLKIEESNIPFQDWYENFHDERKTKSLSELSLEERDVEWFIMSETKDGIYKPEKSTIDRFLFSGKSWSPQISNKLDKKILSKLGIHTIQLRSDAHFDVTFHFNMKGIKVKAPQKIIESYRLEKYCIDDDIVKDIEEKKKIAYEKQKAYERNNKFTLMQHGKVVMSIKDKEDIIEFLENFSPSNKSIEEEVIESVKPIFDNFPKVNKLYIAYWGTYYKYEMAGTRTDIEYDEGGLNRDNISEEDYEQILNLYADNLCPNLDAKILENRWGWSGRGGTIIGVNRVGKSLKVFTEDFDFE